MAFKKLTSSALMGKLMKEYFDNLFADDCRPVAWCSSVGPVELLRAMGFKVFFPENHAAMIGSSKLAADYIPRCTSQGYAPEICSYLTSDIGSFLGGFCALEKAFGYKELPRPQVLVYQTNQCADVREWFKWYGRYYNVPVFGIESFREVDEVEDYHLAAIVSQLKQLAEKLAPIAGCSLSMDKLAEVVAISARGSALWQEVLGTASARPSPITFFDGITQMGPAVVMRATEEGCFYYETLLKELRERVSGGIGAIDGERRRLYWDGMPIWPKTRQLSEFFAERGVCLVASTYASSWVFSALDPAYPLESMARASLELFIDRSERFKTSYISNKLKAFSCDGVIFHDCRTCPNNSNNRYGLAERLKKEGVPVVTIQGDMNNTQLYNEEQTATILEAFLEQLD